MGETHWPSLLVGDMPGILRCYEDWFYLGLGQVTETVHFAEKGGKIIPMAW